MPAIDYYGDLLKLGRPVLTNAEAAARMGCSNRTAGKRLRKLEKAGLVLHVKQGLWSLDRNLPRFALAPYITAPLPAYVSLESALAHHEMIEQVPRQVSVVAPDRPRRISTALGIYEVHQISPELFDGFKGEAETGYVATPEKAIFDSVYTKAASGSIAWFPELELPQDFKPSEALAWVERISSARLRKIVDVRLEEVIAGTTGVSP